MKSQGLTTAITIHPVGNIYVGIKFMAIRPIFSFISLNPFVVEIAVS